MPPAVPRRPLWRRLLRGVVLAGLIWIVLTALLVLVFRWVPLPTTAFMLERKFAAWRTHEPNFALRYRWVPASEVSRDLPIALVAGEDQKFPTHFGFDVQAIQDAMEDADEGQRLRGASTITQQTAKNLFLWGGRSFVRKGLEAYFTVLLELEWPKRRILEVYLNVAEFGDGIYGADAAARAYFGKAPSQLDARESALLAAVLPNPKKRRPDRPSGAVERRAEWIERQVRQLGGPRYLPN